MDYRSKNVRAHIYSYLAPYITICLTSEISKETFIIIIIEIFFHST